MSGIIGSAGSKSGTIGVVSSLNAPSIHLSRTTSHASGIKLVWNLQQHARGGMSHSAGNITAPVSGYYMIFTQLRWGGLGDSETAYFQLSIKDSSGGQLTYNYSENVPDYHPLSCSCIEYITAGDYFYIQADTNKSGGHNVDGNTSQVSLVYAHLV